MTWNPDLVAAVSGSGGALEWLVEVVGALTAVDGTRGGMYVPARYSSAAYPDARTTLDPASVRVDGQSVSPVSWRFNDQSWSFTLLDTDRATVAQVMRRGQLLRLSVGLPGMGRGDYSQVTIGRVVGVSERRRGVIEVQCWGAVSALASRSATALSALTIHETYLPTAVDTTGYTAGDATITLASTSAIEFPAGRYILLKVEPTGGTAFYLRGTAKTATQVTGLDATGSFGTTEVDAPVGSAVTPIWYDQGRPDVLTARLLTSTATGTNGAYDDLPYHWGYGLPVSWVDIDDLIACGTALFTPSSGTMTTRVAVDPPPDDPGAWLSGVLQSHAAWLCTRAGRLTIRGAQDITSRGAVLHHSGVTVADSDIIPGSVEVEWFSRDQPIEYQTARVISASGSSTTTSGLSAGTLPTRWGAYEYDVSGYVFDNESPVRNSILDRVDRWVWSIGETIKVDCRGLRLAGLCPGDVVTLQSSLVSGRLARTVLTYAGGVTAMVTSVAPDWRGGKTSLRLSILPADRADSWG